MSSGRIVLALILLAATALPAHATRVRPLNLEEMTGRSGTIVSGRCIRVRTLDDPALGRSVTEVTLQVGRTFKGPHRRSLTFRTASPAVIGGPTFEVGADLVLFLYPESPLGLTSPVGLGQGRFVSAPDKEGRRIAVNGHDPRLLFERLSPEATRRIAPHLRPDARRQGLPTATLLEMIDALRRGTGE